MKLNQSELKFALPPGILVYINISEHNSKGRLMKLELTVSTTREKQHIVINCLEIWEKYFSNVTINCLSNIHNNLETHNKVRMYWEKYAVLSFGEFMLFLSIMQSLGHYNTLNHLIGYIRRLASSGGDL